MFQETPDSFELPSNPELQPSGAFPLPLPNQETLRHILLGDYSALRSAILRLHTLGYADPTHWSKPIPTGRGGEYVSISLKGALALLVNA